MSLFGWNDVTIVGLILFAITCIIMHIFIFHNDKLPGIIGKNMKRIDVCITPTCNTDLCNFIKKGRGDNYFMHKKTDEYNNSCLITGWEMGHFIFHIFVGYFLNIYASLTVSIGYEVYEKIYHDCASYNDIIINFAGFCIGSYLRHY